MTATFRALVLLAALSPAPAAASTLSLEGEIAALRSAAIAPPAVPNLWQFQITQLAPDGAPVKAGQVMVAFDANELTRRLMEAQGKLKEKQSERAKLVLDLAERERTERLATAEQASNATKAQRKADQPAELLRSVDYRKLVIEREQAERRDALMRQREGLAARQRAAELALVEAELKQAQDETTMLTAAIAALNVTAPRDGIAVVRSNWRGERFEVGSQVFVGQSVAEIPDPATLVARAVLPERDLFKVEVGMPVRVQVQGGTGRVFAGKVVEMGRAVRSKSRQSPVPVVDVTVALTGDTTGLKTGQPVTVEVEAVAVTAVAP
jgi:multidrug resistance efflux pump